MGSQAVSVETTTGHVFQDDFFQTAAQASANDSALLYAPLKIENPKKRRQHKAVTTQQPTEYSTAVPNENHSSESAPSEQTKQSATQAEDVNQYSPKNDEKRKLDLNRLLVNRPSTTFYCRVNDDAMSEAGIFDGDILIVDQSLAAIHGDVVLALHDRELCCRTLDMHNQQLRSDNPKFRTINIEEGSDFDIKGVVISSIRLHRPCKK